MTIRPFPATEWPQLLKLCPEHGASWLPHPEMARILVAENAEGAIQGFLVVQLTPHLEPIWVTPGARGTGVSLALAQHAAAMFPPGQSFYAFAPSPAIERLAQRAGLTKQPWTVYQGAGVPD